MRHLTSREHRDIDRQVAERRAAAMQAAGIHGCSGCGRVGGKHFLPCDLAPREKGAL